MRCRICGKVRRCIKKESLYSYDRDLCRWCYVLFELDCHYLVPIEEISERRKY